jgi:predicted phosphoadenosine phosphosulfate sulfurtransferase
MIFYSDKNVYEAALERFRYIFREFYGKRKIVVTMSGGKDLPWFSTLRTRL